MNGIVVTYILISEMYLPTYLPTYCQERFITQKTCDEYGRVTIWCVHRNNNLFCKQCGGGISWYSFLLVLIAAGQLGIYFEWQPYD